MPDYLASLPGASQASIVSLFGETDPIEAFTSPAQRSVQLTGTPNVPAIEPRKMRVSMPEIRLVFRTRKCCPRKG